MYEITIGISRKEYLNSFLISSSPYISSDYMGDNFYLFIRCLNSNERHVFALEETVKENIDWLNERELVSDNKEIIEILKLIGIDVDYVKLKHSLKTSNINDQYFNKLFSKKNIHLFSKERTREFIDKSYLYLEYSFINFIDNKYLNELYGDDLKEKIIEKMVTDKKLRNKTFFVKQIIRSTLTNFDQLYFPSLLTKEQRKELFIHVLDQKKKGKFPSIPLELFSSNNLDILKNINWNDYVGTLALKNANSELTNFIKKFSDNDGEKKVEIKYGSYISKLYAPNASNIQISLTFLFTISDEEFEVISKLLQGKTRGLLIRFNSSILYEFLTEKKRAEKFLELFMNDIQFDKAKNKEYAIKRVIEMRYIIESVVGVLDIEYSKEVKKYILTHDLKK